MLIINAILLIVYGGIFYMLWESGKKGLAEYRLSKSKKDQKIKNIEDKIK